jgi:hypothetical protein
MTQHDYQKQAKDWIDSHGITFHVELIGSNCPHYCEDALKQRDMGKINTFPRKSHIHGNHYRITLKRSGKPDFTVDFWNSYNDEEVNAFFRYTPGTVLTVPRETIYWDKLGKYPNRRRQPKRVPTPYDLLASIEKAPPGAFEEWCMDLGYDTDSRRAFDIYGRCQSEWRRVTRFFSPQEIEELQEIQ